MNDFRPLISTRFRWFVALLRSHTDTIPPLQSAFVDWQGVGVLLPVGADFILVPLLLNVELLEICLNIDECIFWQRLFDHTKI